MEARLIFLTLALCVVQISGDFFCRNITNCQCFPNGKDYEFQCPNDYPDSNVGLLIHVNEKLLTIDCSFVDLNLDMLPNMTELVETTIYLKINSCNLSTRTLQELFDKFHMNLTKLTIEHSNLTLDNTNHQKFEHITVLQLGNSKVGQLKTTLELFPNLINLDLQALDVQLEPHMFENNPLLTWLDLSENDMVSIPEGVFKPLKNLRKLHLWGNNLTEITDTTFEGLDRLISLELSVNQISRISPKAFEKLPNLSTISLNRNQIIRLPPGLFKNNTKITDIRIRQNPFTYIPDYSFANLKSLQAITLELCKLEGVPQNLFQGSSNLTKINLSGNQITELPQNLFSTLTQLKEIDLSKNNITRLGELKDLEQLEILRLSHNKLHQISARDFKHLNDLQELYLERNRIRHIERTAFYGLTKLKIFNLAGNQYDSDDVGAINPLLGFSLLSNNVELVEVKLEHNLIRDPELMIGLSNKVNLRSLKLNNNRINHVDVTDFQSLSGKLEIDLQFNNITEVNFFPLEDAVSTTTNTDARSILQDTPESVLYLDNNPIICDCRNYDLLRYMQDQMDPRVRVQFDLKYEGAQCLGSRQNLTFAQAPPLLLTCVLSDINTDYKDCPDQCSCYWRPHDLAIVVDCTGLQLTSIPDIVLPKDGPLYNQTILDLERNLLSQGPNSTIQGISNVTRLTLSHNKIETINWIPPKLEQLKLDNNKLKYLDGDVLDMMNSTSLAYITLENNSWVCDCRADNFTNFLRAHTKEIAVSSVLCDKSSTPMIELNRKNLCHEWTMAYTILLVVSFVLIVMIYVALYYRYQQEIKVWLYARGWCLWWVTEEEVDKDKIYDAFLSFSHKDIDFVEKTLIPTLEAEPQPYKLCIHYRDWIPGPFISKHVANSVANSRRTIVVLSQNFLESDWAKSEFRTAHTKGIADGHARVIVILYGEVDVKSLDSELQAYLRTNTYVKWGDPYFWNKLRYALPHSKKRIAAKKNNQKLANMMNFIDEKFNLVVSHTATNPNSTPPVLTLDASQLDKRFKNETLESGKLIITNETV